ncbi:MULTISPECIES: glycosyltransferase family 2 protein [Chryseobacterium]|uniref:glycosyltransferase family 2 protein n=1 Tax=Chryseobacterium sp. R2A-55 TaxID=2744445 RepID=UPI001F1BC31B|nr:glycosyltransferase family A protein [Chryseobacterium sp. R2A-55]
METKISVIIPVFNAQETIVKALDSIKNQNGAFDFEIIVVNDGSTDESVPVIERYSAENPQMKIILKSQKNGGVSAARNVGLELVTGDFIAFLDADDEWLPNKTWKQLALLRGTSPNIDLISSSRNNSKLLFPYFLDQNNLAKVTFNKLLLRNEMHPSTVVFKKTILKKTGFFDSKQRYAEDVYFFLNAAKHYDLYILGENLVIAGGGKRSFGVSGLSANLLEMKRGYQKNVRDMYQAGNISYSKYRFLRIFYRFKYFVLVLRRNYYNLK